MIEDQEFFEHDKLKPQIHLDLFHLVGLIN